MGAEIMLLYFFILVLLILLYVYVIQPPDMFDAFEDIITNSGYPTNLLCKMPLTSVPQQSGPADATLSTPRSPYNLLEHMAPGEGRLANLKSECAFIADGQRHIEKTGSYGQVTNNYKRKNPDNGSTWLHELALSFYKL